MEILTLAIIGVGLLGSLLILSAPAFYILGHNNGRRYERYILQKNGETNVV